MKRKILQHFSDMLCHIFVGWRIGDDIAKIIQFPEKIVFTIDVLRGESDAPSADKLHIVDELHAWFVINCEKHKIEVDKIKKAVLIAEIIQIHSLKKKRLRINCSSFIQTDEKEYKSEIYNNESWSFI